MKTLCGLLRLAIGAAAVLLALSATQAAYAQNRWANSQNSWGNSKTPYANSQNSWGRTPSPKPGVPSNYSGYLTIPSAPIVENPNMTPRYVNSGDIPDGLRSPQRPVKRKARKAKPAPDAPPKNP